MEYIIINIVSVFVFSAIFLFFYLFQNRLFKFSENKFKKKSYDRNNKIHNYTLVIFFSIIYIIVGVFIEFRLPIGGANILNLSVNYSIILVSTLLLGCFYSSMVVLIGNTVAFIIIPSGAWLLLFPLCFATVTLAPFIIMYLVKKHVIFMYISFIFSILLVIIAIIGLELIINSSIFDANTRKYIFSCLIIFLIVMLISSLFLFIFKENKKLKFIIFSSLVIYYLFIAFIADPILLHFLYQVDYKILYISRCVSAPITFLINIFVSYFLIKTILKNNKNSFLLEKCLT